MKTQLLKCHQRSRPWKQAGISLMAVFGLLLLLGSCSDGYVGDESDKSDEPLFLPTVPPPSTPIFPSPTSFNLGTVPPDAAPKNRSLSSNTVLKKPARRGLGSLQVSNGNSQDAYLKLVDSAKLVAAFYVKSNSTFTLKRIPDGVYQLLFVSGDDWDGKTRTFTKNASFTKFDRDLEFVTSRQTKGRRIYTRYSRFRVTLNPVIDGTAKTSAIDDREFNNK
jgi:hypothetical protein